MEKSTWEGNKRDKIQSSFSWTTTESRGSFFLSLLIHCIFQNVSLSLHFGALLLNKDHWMLRSKVYYFTKCFLGRGGLRGKTAGFVWQGHDLWQLWSLSFSSSPSPETPNLQRNQVFKSGLDRIGIVLKLGSPCLSFSLSISPSLTLSFPLSLLSPPLNKTELNWAKETKMYCSSQMEASVA